MSYNIERKAFDIVDITYFFRTKRIQGSGLGGRGRSMELKENFLGLATTV